MSKHQVMSTEQVVTQIREVRELGTKYGPLVKERQLSFPVVSAIIDYYEEDGESEAVQIAEAKAEEYRTKLHKAQGAAGGLTKRINKLEEELDSLRAVQDNNRRLSRISGYAAELVEHLERCPPFIDEGGDALTEHPMYIALRAEIGV